MFWHSFVCRSSRAIHHTVYSYDHTIYDRKPYLKQALPVWLWVTAISIAYGCVTGNMCCLENKIILENPHVMLQCADSTNYWPYKPIVTRYCLIWAWLYICCTNTAVLSWSPNCDGMVTGSILWWPYKLSIQVWWTALCNSRTQGQCGFFFFLFASSVD